jgi:hypothetical protein
MFKVLHNEKFLKTKEKKVRKGSQMKQHKPYYWASQQQPKYLETIKARPSNSKTNGLQSKILISQIIQIKLSPNILIDKSTFRHERL